VIIQAGDLAVEIDTGDNQPGVIQRHEDGQWIDYLVDGKQAIWPVGLEELPAGRYRVIDQPQ
jgi:hypothetical protein